jgi:FixJ family two-component response regulator
MNKAKPTVFIVDDEKVIIDSLTLLMKSVSLPVKSFSHAQKFIDAYNPDEPGCLLLDIRMPHITGLELQNYLVQKKYALPIIFMTGHGDIPMAVDAIKKGALDLIQKPFQADALLIKIKAALAVDKSRRSMATKISQCIEKIESLTPREREIMGKIINGDTNKVIAIDLDISQRTVEIHRTHIMQKTQAKSLAQLIRMTVVLEQS